MNDAHLNVVRDARESVMVPLRAVVKKIEAHRKDGELSLPELDDKPLDKLLDIAKPFVKLAFDVIKLERLLYGLPSAFAFNIFLIVQITNSNI